MTEKRFFNFMLIQGILLVILGLCMLILPKVTSVTFGLMLCLAIIIYGIYKIIHAFLTKNYERHFLLNVIIGAIIASFGIILLCLPHINLAVIASIIGIYLLAESTSNTALAVQARKSMSMWRIILLIAIMQFIFGLIIILGLPMTSLWTIGILLGINFLASGMGMIAFKLSNKYDYNR